MAPASAAVLLVVLVTGASAHGHLLRAVLRPQAADEQAGCAGNAGAACTGELSMRKLIPRSQNTGPCPDPGPSAGQEADVPPGCEANFVCDHCGLEKTAAEKEIVGGDGAKWWTRMPAAHWDEPDQWPINPCMSRDEFGAGGVGLVAPGDQLETTMYVNADHSGHCRLGWEELARRAPHHGGRQTPATFHGRPTRCILSSLPPGRIVRQVSAPWRRKLQRACLLAAYLAARLPARMRAACTASRQRACLRVCVQAVPLRARLRCELGQPRLQRRADHSLEGAAPHQGAAGRRLAARRA